MGSAKNKVESKRARVTGARDLNPELAKLDVWRLTNRLDDVSQRYVNEVYDYE